MMIKTSKIKKIAAAFVVFLLLFPYFQLVPLETDIQPNFLIGAVLLGPILLTIRPQERLFIPAMLAVLLIYTANDLPAISDIEIGNLRAWASYITPLVVIVFVKSLFREQKVVSVIDRWIEIAFWLWVGFGMLQLMTGSVLLELTHRNSTTLTRGWMSFAPEPSAYSTMLFLFAAYFLAHWRLSHVLAALVAAVLFSQSALGLVYFFILAACHCIVWVRSIVFWVALGLVAVAIFVFFETDALLNILPGGARLRSLFEVGYTNYNMLAYDNSIASRLADMGLAINTIVDGPFMGNGFDSGLKIKSGWGAMIYEMGLLGLLLAIGWILYFLSKAAQRGKYVFAPIIATVIMLFSSTPLSHPFASFVIVFLIHTPTNLMDAKERYSRWSFKNIG